MKHALQGATMGMPSGINSHVGKTGTSDSRGFRMGTWHLEHQLARLYVEGAQQRMKMTRALRPERRINDKTQKKRPRY